MTKKDLITFLALVAGAGCIYKLSGLKDVFYAPMQEFMQLSHQQIGLAMSVFGFVHVTCGFASLYISDRFSKKFLIPLSLAGVGCVGVYLSTLPSFTGILLSYALLALFSEVIFWPVLLKAIRLLGNSSNQGRLFGFLEAGRGVFDTAFAFGALGVFAFFSSTAFAFSSAIWFYSGCAFVLAVLCFFLLEHDPDTRENLQISKNRAVWQGMKKALANADIWIASLVVFCAYFSYCGITYFIPFLRDQLALSAVALGVYGIFNQYALKMLAGPAAGFCADFIFRSATKYLRFALCCAVVLMCAFIALLGFSAISSAAVMMCFTLAFAFITFTLRATYMAPIDEIGTEQRISGSAFSIACMLGYSPQFFAYPIYGHIIDTFEVYGYQIVFGIMAAFASLGALIAHILWLRISERRG